MFIRFQYENKSLSAMQRKADREHGLCCYEFDGDPFEAREDDIISEFMEMSVDVGESGYIVIFDGKIRSLCPEGYKVYPTELIAVYKVRCSGRDENGYKKWEIE